MLLAILFAGCGSDEDGGADRNTDEAAASSPFTFDAGAVPEGYRLVTAGRGDDRQAWGDDSVGTDEPFTVLAPPGEDAGSDEVVVVSVTGFEGYEGGLSQAGLGNGRWTSVLDVRGDDLAVRSASPGAQRTDLEALNRRVVPDSDRGRAPSVERGGDLEVIGSVDADALIALRGGFEPFSGDVPGPAGSYGAGWLPTGRGTLGVVVLRGDAADLDALAAIEAFSASGVDVDVRRAAGGDRPAVVVESTFGGAGPPPSTTRSVVRHAATGQLVVVRASGPAVPEDEELLALASSVRPASAESWEDFVLEATGGPGLVPDPGAAEVARGTEGEVEWLLQVWPDAESAPVRRGGEVLYAQGERPGPVVDGCLKLSTRQRACTSVGGDHAGFIYEYARPGAAEGVDFPPYVIVETQAPGETLRVTSASGAVTVDLHQLAGTDRRVGVAFADVAGFRGCGQLPRIQVLDGNGDVVACPAG